MVEITTPLVVQDDVVMSLREQGKSSLYSSQSLAEPVYARMFLSLLTLMVNNNVSA